MHFLKRLRRKVINFIEYRSKKVDFIMVILCIFAGFGIASLLDVLQGDPLGSGYNQGFSLEILQDSGSLFGSYEDMDEATKERLKDKIRSRMKDISDEDKERLKGFISRQDADTAKKIEALKSDIREP